jgi:hypothetical protein
MSLTFIVLSFEEALVSPLDHWRGADRKTTFVGDEADAIRARRTASALRMNLVLAARSGQRALKTAVPQTHGFCTIPMQEIFDEKTID